jgi:predicted amidohydrolase YtcJ
VIRTLRLVCVVFAGWVLCLGVFAQSPGKIEISKMNPAGLLVDKYSYMARFVTPPISPEVIKVLEENRKKYADDWIDLAPVKILLDGVIEAHTAAMLEPYTNDPGNRGQLYFDPDKYKEAVMQLDHLGFRIFTHAIGDRAIRFALDAYEAANKANGRTDARDKIEHIENPSAEDIPRFGKLGVIASMQPLHTTPKD